jgi:hypothetical protein
MSEGGVGTVIRHTLGDSTLLRGDGGLLEAASGLDALAAATIGRIGCVDPLPAAAVIIGLVIGSSRFDPDHAPAPNSQTQHATRPASRQITANGTQPRDSQPTSRPKSCPRADVREGWAGPVASPAVDLLAQTRRADA